MKMYLIGPKTRANEDSNSALTAATRTTNSIIVETLFACLTYGADNSHNGIWYGSFNPDGNPPDAEYNGVSIRHLADPAALRQWLSEAIDSKHGHGCEVRSTINCRVVTFGYDGQAFLTLRTEDPEPVVSDSGIVTIEECSKWLIDTDYQDGMIPDLNFG
ncbi:MAG: hypothetical protein KA312_06245 [Sphingorhabdus sp.]|nr:hypothetical protein [Sphingorhabdus sp.]